ncbi:hypothetical protein [Nocardia wallacei]|uniref:hypothetical protein n=1 Tax=Nocardia wallacei TaxID=480035 RepID=UPI0024547E5A|nr:hypothetical protein [Nocardia wallacei]
MTDRLTDEQFAELLHYIPLTYEGLALEDMPEWMGGRQGPDGWEHGWLGPDGGVLSLLAELKAERERSARLAEKLVESQRRIALVREVHFEYLPAGADFYCCAGCNITASIGGIGYVPWPCDTYKALTGEA